MAPVAVPVEQPSTAAPASNGVQKTFGNYKDQAPGAQTYNRKLEEEGDETRPKANVLMLHQHGGQERLTLLISTRIIFPRGM